MQVYTWNEFNVEIRGFIIDGNPWLVAKDLCDYLELSDVSKSLERLDDDEKLTRKVFVSGQDRTMWLVNESGTYALILRSNKPKAREFRKWITNEVLPSIRKTGRYEIGQNGLNGQNGLVRHPMRSRCEKVNAELLNLLWLIGESLQQGELTQVALELGVSRQTVYMVLNGYSRNAKVLMALYQRAKANRACGMLYYEPKVMAERLVSGDGEVTVSLPAVVYGKRKRGGQPGNGNARKSWRKECK